ncbi:hypothetical protein TrRE_jg1511, partial [Triparma retinervis]
FQKFRTQILSLSPILDSLQVSVFLDDFPTVLTYPPKVRAFIPTFVGFIDYITVGSGATKNGNAAVGGATGETLKIINRSLAVNLRYEVGRIFASVERMGKAAEIDDPEETCNAYGSLLLHVDRFYKSAGIYPFYNPVASNEVYYKGFTKDQLVFDKGLEGGAGEVNVSGNGKGKKGGRSEGRNAGLKDLVVVVGGEAMGRTGTVVSVVSGSGNRIVKLDELGGKGGKIMGGVREIKVVKNEDCRRRVGGEGDAVFDDAKGGGRRRK